MRPQYHAGCEKAANLLHCEYTFDWRMRMDIASTEPQPTRIRRLIDLIKNDVPDERFDMETWLQISDWGDRDWSEGGQRIAEEPACMTAACAAGWCTWMAIQDGDRTAIQEGWASPGPFAERWLSVGLPTDDPDGYDRWAFQSRLDDIFQGEAVTRDEVAGALDRLASEYGL